MKNSGEVPVVQFAVRASYSSSEGPIFQAGLGQFTIGTIRWKPAPTKGNIQFEYGDITVQSAATGEQLVSPLTEYELRWEVEANGRFVRCTNIDSVVDFMTQVSLSSTISEGDDAVEHVFLEDYVNSMRRSLMTRTEAEVRQLWASLCETWTVSLRSSLRSGFASEPVVLHGVQCTRSMANSSLTEPRDAERAISELLESSVHTIDHSCEEITDSGAGRLSDVVSDIVSLTGVKWQQRDLATLETATFRPYITEQVRDVKVEFRILGTIMFEVVHSRKRMYFMWDNIDAASSKQYLETEYAQFYDECAARLDELALLYPPVPRKMDSRINDAFDIFDGDGDGKISLKDVESVLRTASESSTVEANALHVFRAMLASPGGSDPITWIPFRCFVVRQLTLPTDQRMACLNVDDLLQTSMTGELGKFGGKMFRKRWQKRFFVLNRNQGTLSYFASPADVKPKGAMDLRDYEKCEINPDPPRGEVFVFDLVPRAASDAKRYSLAASSDVDRARWINVVNRAIEQADMLADRVDLTDAFVASVGRLVSSAIQQSISHGYAMTLST